ncbi:hypothetical protein C8R46DRAFT_1024899 [Mycena filopes]|nr:hypothetical protein C8R46DRAFT_1024899 [Mycena filopes]
MPDALIIRVLSFWALPEIISCDRVSVVLHNIVRYYKSIVWDPDSFFKPWFIDSPITFRKVLDNCGAVVSGSQITQFFDRTRYNGSDMDIFLRIGGLQTMAQWLLTQGYSYKPELGPDEYTAFHLNLLRLSSRMVAERNSMDEAIKGVFNYCRYITSATVVYVQKVQLVVVDTNPVDHIIFDFHSSERLSRMVSIQPLT